MTKVLIEAEKLILVEEDHGGYKAGRCLLCNSYGWLNGGAKYRMRHEVGCDVAKALGQPTL